MGHVGLGAAGSHGGGAAGNKGGGALHAACTAAATAVSASHTPRTHVTRHAHICLCIEAATHNLCDMSLSIPAHAHAPTVPSYSNPPPRWARCCSIVDLLLPGENVLRALQRLAGTRLPADRPTAAVAAPSPAAAPQSWAVSPAVLGSTYAAAGAGSPVSQPHRAHPPAAADAQQLQRAQQVGGVKRLGSMAAEAKEAFDALTEASTMLLEGGDYLIHSMAREEVERQLAAQEGCGWLARVHAVTHAGGVLRYFVLYICCDDAWTCLEARLLCILLLLFAFFPTGLELAVRRMGGGVTWVPPWRGSCCRGPWVGQQ